jgi:Dehydrogenases with different specificities (related to short-chain alcohol dehydrogenases)
MTEKYALVTGGSRGIGRAICTALASMGYHVLINYKGNQQAAEETQKACMDLVVQTETLLLDVSNEEEIAHVLDAWIEAHPNAHVEVLVNNAGIRQDTLLAFMNNEQWRSVLDTSLERMFLITKNYCNPC